MPDTAHERIRAAIAAVPAGRVASYGDIAAAAGAGSPRYVGWVLREDGQDLPWHRVLRADGTAAPHLAERQWELLAQEGVPAPGGRVRMDQWRWAPEHTPDDDA